MQNCTLCPRMCGAARDAGATGICGAPQKIKIARAALHMWEEPCISGTRGSGAVFFSHCHLGCVFCQNAEISRGGLGAAVTTRRLADIFLELEAAGAHNINLVTPTHYLPDVLCALDFVRPRLAIPVIMNCGGYERVETLRMCRGYIDIYMPDFKYKNSALSSRYAGAGDYFTVAAAAIGEMYAQQPSVEYDESGILRRGLTVRHLVLPGCSRDSLDILDELAAAMPGKSFLLSLMGQYTPPRPLPDAFPPQLARRLTTFEYRRVEDYARALGLQGFAQSRASASADFIPQFDLTGVSPPEEPDA